MTGPVWMPPAWRELGVRETPGPVATPRILTYAQATTLAAHDDETPWCSAFVNWILAGFAMRTTHSASARSWQTWGIPCATDRYGAVVVLSRGANPALGHVGFLVDGDGTTLWLLGGNQGDAVSVAPFPRARVVSARFPV